MKTSVKSIRIVGEDGVARMLSIRTKNGDLKTHFLKKLVESGAVVPDERILRILLELLDERKKKIERLEPIKVSAKRGKRRCLNPEDRFFSENGRVGIVPRMGFSDRKHDLTKEERDDLLMEMNERM